MTEFTIPPEALLPLNDKVVLITGSTSGIGKATVALCLSLGAKVIAGDINNPPSPPSDKDNGDFIFVQTDVTDWSSLRNLFQTGNTHFGRIDHVFANAGIGPRGNFLEETFEDGDDGLLAPPKLDTVNINLLGVIYTVRLGVYYLRLSAPEQEAGGSAKSIVLTASASSFQNFGAADYATAKHGVLGIMRGLVGDLERMEGGKGKVRINAIAPSWTATGLVPREVLEGMGVGVQEPEVVARSVVMLFNDGGRHGELIYSWEGRYFEINKSEGGMLDATMKMLPNPESEDEVMERLKEMARQE